MATSAGLAFAAIYFRARRLVAAVSTANIPGAVAVFADIVDIRSQIYTEQLVANGEPRVRRILAI